MKSSFKFLDSYTKNDRDIFFGRDHEITELYRRVFESRILLVYGISGTGKSSLVNCGLASRFDESDWLPINIRRGENIITSLNEALSKYAITGLKKDLTFSEKVQSLYLDHFKPVYLVFDQFEELFIFGTEEERTEFLRLIKEIVRSKTQCRVLFIIREEFLAGMTEFEYELPEIFTNRFRVEKMKRANAVLAVEGPCRVNGIGLEAGFSEELIDKICPQRNEIELTYMQIYIDRIFRISEMENKEGENLSFSKELLVKAGSVSDLLGQFLDEQIRESEDPEKGMAVLKSFVSVQGTKKQMTQSEIMNSLKSFRIEIAKTDLIMYLTRFVDLRILKEKDESGRYELRHDVLADKIYDKFTAVEKDIIEVRQFIDNSLHNWEIRGVLMAADDLDFIAPYESRLYLTKKQLELIKNSKDSLIRAKRRRRNITITAVITLLLIFAGFTIWALKERNKSLVQYHRATVLMLVAKAREISANDQTKGIRYAQMAYSYDSTDYLTNQVISDIFNSTELKPFYLSEYRHSGGVTSAIFSPDGKNILTASMGSTAKLWDLSGKCLTAFSGHSLVVSAVFSPDGKKILTGSSDKTAKLWDLSGRCLATLSGHSNGVRSAVFSPDGRIILTGSSDKTAKLWDLSGKCLATFSGHSEGVNSAVFSPDGKNILTVSDDKTAKLWDLSGRCLATLFGHSESVNSATFSPDGKNILTASDDRTAKLWNLSGMCVATLFGHSESVNSAAFSPDGKNILTASDDKTAKLWDLSGKCLATFVGHTNYVWCAVFSPDDKSILTASFDKTAKIWDLSGKCQFTLSGHKLSVRSAVFSPDGKNILTASDDRTAKLWDLSEIHPASLQGHLGEVNSAEFSPDGKNILTASRDNTAKLWDLSGRCLATLSGHSDEVASAIFSPDGKNILTASRDNTAKLWDLSGKCLATLSGHSDEVASAVFSPDGKEILTASQDNTAKLWDRSGKCLATLSGHSDEVASAVFSPNGKEILTASQDNTAKLWDMSGKCLSTFSGHSESINSAVFSPDGKEILTASQDRTAKLWDLSGKCLATLSGHIDYVWCAVFSPNGKSILTASDDKTAKLWDLSGKCLATLSGHSDRVLSAVFSTDGKKILTASYDKTAKLWDLSGKCFATLSGHSDRVLTAVFSPDGKNILTASCDNTAKVWFTPVYINSWIVKDRIGILLPAEKAEINALDDFKTVLSSDDPALLMEYADYYLGNHDTTRATTLYERLLLITPQCINKTVLGGIYRKQKNSKKYNELYKNEPAQIIRDELSDMADTSASDNYSYKFSYYTKKVKLYENLLKTDQSVKIDAAVNYDKLGWFGLLSGNYPDALAAIQRGIELDPSNYILYTNLPLCYLFTNQYEKAKSKYLMYKDKLWTGDNNGNTFREVFLDNIKKLEDKGIKHPDFENIKNLLKK